MVASSYCIRHDRFRTFLSSQEVLLDNAVLEYVCVVSLRGYLYSKPNSNYKLKVFVLLVSYPDH